MDNIPIALMKIVKCERYAQELLNGKLHCNSIQWFRKHHDEFEGNAYIFVESITYGGRTIPNEHIKGPVIFHNNNAKLYAYCMFLWSAPIVDSEIEINLPEQIGDLQNLASRFGQHTVIVNPTKFLDRVDETINQKDITSERRIIHYADPENLRPESPRARCFNKRERFSSEKEYRFLFDSQLPNCGESAFCLDIGDIHDIAVCMKTEEIHPLISRIGTKAFGETYLGLYFGEETPKQSPSDS